MKVTVNKMLRIAQPPRASVLLPYVYSNLLIKDSQLDPPERLSGSVLTAEGWVSASALAWAGEHRSGGGGVCQPEEPTIITQYIVVRLCCAANVAG